jgi:membrane complex biogenesis BtpA family protein
MNKLKDLFKNKKPFVIGMIHTAPLLGYENSPKIEEVERKFLADFRALEDGGVDAIMIENNYDIPHYEQALRSTIPQLTDFCLRARKSTMKPLGLCVLWNDYETALSIAKLADFQFIRIPVFVDRVQTDYGIYEPKADEVIAFRKKIDAENVLIFTDVQVKHAEHLIKRPLNEAVKEAIEKHSDGIIITGKWTGDAPTTEDVIQATATAGDVPVILGSGVTPENLHDYDVDAFIVGSYFKGDNNPEKKDYHNIYPWMEENKVERVRKFMESI